MAEQPPYEWNPLWTDVIDDINPAYVSAVRRMVIASINWLAEHPAAEPKWKEPSQESMARAAGLPLDTPIIATGAWEDVYLPSNPWARRWFRAISDACGKGNAAPSAFMMSKAVACGMLFKNSGWDEFNQFMLENSGSGKPS